MATDKQALEALNERHSLNETNLPWFGAFSQSVTNNRMDVTIYAGYASLSDVAPSIDIALKEIQHAGLSGSVFMFDRKSPVAGHAA